MAADDQTDYGESESGAAIGPSARIIESDKTLEDPVTIDLGYPWPVVGDFDDDGVEIAIGRKPNLVFCMPFGVVDQIAHRMRQLIGVAPYA